MNFEEIIATEVNKALESLFGGLPTATLSQAEVQNAMQQVIDTCRTHSRDEVLLNLLTTQDIAKRFNISHARARRLASDRHDQYGIGTKIGSVWVFTPNDLPLLKPGKAGKSVYSAKIQATVANQLRSIGGASEVNRLPDRKRRTTINMMVQMVMNNTGCTRQTARQHLAQALQRAQQNNELTR